MPGFGCAARLAVSPAPRGDRIGGGRGTPESGACFGCRRTKRSTGVAALRAVRGPVAEGDVRDPAGRGNLPVLDPHDVPDPGGERGGAGAARSVAAPAVSEAGAAGDGSQPGVELGHHQAAGAGEVDVFLSVRDSGYLQPVRGGVDGGASGERGISPAADRGNEQQTEHNPGATNDPCGPGDVDDLQAG